MPPHFATTRPPSPPLRASPVSLLALLLCLLAPAADKEGSLAGQLPVANPAALGTGNNFGALARGYGAIGGNPANLALPGGPAYSLAVLPVQLRGGLHPIGFGDIAPFQDSLLPDDTKEAWLQAIERAGGQSGGGSAHATPLAMSFRGAGIQLSTVAFADASLNPDAAELLLFGNAGRTGKARDFDLRDSSLRGAVVTTAAVSFARRLRVRRPAAGAEQHFALGATLKYSVGNALFVARDQGSTVLGDPLSGSIRFPIVQSDSTFDGSRLDKGSGVGLDVGAAWHAGDWTVGLVLQNLVHTFGWDEAKFFVRSGEAYFDEREANADFELHPLSAAPGALLAELRSMTFAPSARASAAWRLSPRLSLGAELRRRFGGGIETGPRTHLGAGLEYAPVRVLPLRAGVAAVSGGAQVAGGAGLVLGPVEIAASALLRAVDGRREPLATAGVALSLR